MTTNQEKLPYGVGVFTGRWTLLWSVMAVLLGWGLYAYSQQLIYGESVTGMRDIGTMQGVPWGLYIVFVVYFMGVSFAGITLAAMVRLLKLKQLEPIGRIAEWLTIVSLLLGAMCILADLGQPLRGLINLPRYARPQSPFFGTFAVVIAGYLFASLVYFYLSGRKDAAWMAQKETALKGFYRLWASGYQNTPQERMRHHLSTFWLAVAIVPLLITATSTLGFVFGLQIGRAGWFSALQAPGFVVIAGISGLGIIILIAAAFKNHLGQQTGFTDEMFRRLGNLMMILCAIYLYFMVVEWLSTMYTGHEQDRAVMEVIKSGEYAPLYWLSFFGLGIPALALFWQWVFKKYQLWILVLCGISVNLAAIAKRLALVIPSQTHGSLLPYEVGSYSPTWVEYGVIIGIVSFGILLYTVFIKIFPIIPIEPPELETDTQVSLAGDGGRVAVAVSMVVAGFVLQFVSYLFLSAPLGIPTGPEYSNPRMDFAPSLFVLGVMLVFIAAVVYELFPARGETPEGV